LLYIHSFPTRRSSDLLHWCLKKENASKDSLSLPKLNGQHGALKIISPKDKTSRQAPTESQKPMRINRHKPQKPNPQQTLGSEQQDRKSTRLNSSHVAI